MLQTYRTKLKSATQGHSLLKTKADALTMKNRTLKAEAADLKNSLETEINKAYYKLAKVNYSTEFSNNWSQAIIQSVKNASTTLVRNVENVAGVKINNYELLIEKNELLDNRGLIRGQNTLIELKEQFTRVLTLLVKHSSLVRSLESISRELKQTNRRVNALDTVMIPNLQMNINYITKELDELEREEFYRLKKIQQKKQSDKFEL